MTTYVCVVAQLTILCVDRNQSTYKIGMYKAYCILHGCVCAINPQVYRYAQFLIMGGREKWYWQVHWRLLQTCL